MKLFRSRPRRAAVALFAFGGLMAGVGGAMVPAQAHEADGKCLAVSVWIYKSQEGRDYEVGPQQCLYQSPFHHSMYIPLGHQSNTPPQGLPGGAGVEVWIPTT